MDAFDKLTALDADRIHTEVDNDQRHSFAKSRKRTLPVKDITVPNDYPTTLDYEKFDALVADIAKHGIKERIQVSERGTRYILEHGRARLEAARKLGHETIKCEVLSEWRPKVERKKAPREPLPNEPELIKQAQDGDKEALDKLTIHYYRLATTVAGRKGKKKGLEYADADSSVYEPMVAAILTYDPTKKTKLGTWIGTKVKGGVTAVKRELKKQQRILDLCETKHAWMQPQRPDGIKPEMTKCACGLVWIKRPELPNVPLQELVLPPEDLYAIVKPEKRKRGFPVDPQEKPYQKECDGYQKREEEVRVGRARIEKLEPALKERGNLDRWLKQRKGVNKDDQEIARLLFVDVSDAPYSVKVEWAIHPTISDRDRWIGSRYTPAEVCDEIDISPSKLNAAIKRIVKAVTGKTEEELLAEIGAEEAEREERIRAIVVPDPNLPSKVRKALLAAGPEPTPEEAASAIGWYWHKVVARRDQSRVAAQVMTGDDLGWGWNPRANIEKVQRVISPRDLEIGIRKIVADVSDAIKGRTGADYLLLGQCIEVIKSRL
jgi:hypothetical protein